MIVAALASFGLLLLAWLVAPAEERRAAIATTPAREPPVDGLAEAA